MCCFQNPGRPLGKSLWHINGHQSKRLQPGCRGRTRRTQQLQGPFPGRPGDGRKIQWFRESTLPVPEVAVLYALKNVWTPLLTM